MPSSSPEGAKILAPSDMYDCQKRRSNHQRKNLPRAGAPSTIKPTRLRGGPSFRCCLTPSAPMKSPVSFLSLPIEKEVHQSVNSVVCRLTNDPA